MQCHYSFSSSPGARKRAISFRCCRLLNSCSLHSTVFDDVNDASVLLRYQVVSVLLKDAIAPVHQRSRNKVKSMDPHKE